MSKKWGKNGSKGVYNEEYGDLYPAKEIKIKAAKPLGDITGYEYGPLNVMEDTSKGGRIEYSLDMGEHGELEMTYSLSLHEGRAFYALEAMSDGCRIDDVSDIYEDYWSSSYIKRVEDLLEEGKLPEEYRQPVADFLDDIFWEQ